MKTPSITWGLFLVVSQVGSGVTPTDGVDLGSSNSVPIGSNSIASGNGNSVSNGSLAIGNSNIAGNYSMALGDGSIADWGSISSGGYNTIDGNSYYSIAAGEGNNLGYSGSSALLGTYNSIGLQWGSAAIGNSNIMQFPFGKSGIGNVLLGQLNRIDATVASAPNDLQGTVLVGTDNESSSTMAFAFGKGNIGQTDTVTIGTYAATVPGAALIVGKGANSNSRSNGLVLLRTGEVQIPGNVSLGSTSGIYFGSNTAATLKANTNGSAIFPAQTTFQGGIALSGGQLSIADSTDSTSSSTGALTILGGIGAAKDSWFNGVRIGKGNNNVSTNTAVGSLALNAISTGLNNTALGASSLSINTSGSSNTGIGTSALAVNTTGGGNTAVGSRSLQTNTIGTGNTAFGTNALQANTTGSSNSSLGLNAQYYNTTGTNNTALARMSLYYNTTGGDNIAIGYGAGRFHADGTTPLTDPESCIYIGANSRGKDNNDANSIVIGSGSIGDGANTTVIGNSSTVKTRIFGGINTSSITVTGNTDSGGEALVVEGHTRLKGQVIIEQTQGDISMGIYDDPTTGGL